MKQNQVCNQHFLKYSGHNELGYYVRREREKNSFWQYGCRAIAIGRVLSEGGWRRERKLVSLGSVFRSSGQPLAFSAFTSCAQAPCRQLKLVSYAVTVTAELAVVQVAVTVQQPPFICKQQQAQCVDKKTTLKKYSQMYLYVSL